MTLPSELERFADEAVTAGRCCDRSEVAAGLRLLQRQEAERAAFIKTLEEAERAGPHRRVTPPAVLTPTA